MDNKKLLPALLGCVLRDEKVPQQLVPEDWQSLLELAYRHKVHNTLACILPLLPERPDEALCRTFEGMTMEQMLISSNQLHGARQLQESFESRGLYNMMLKGVQTKLLYPQDYMRSMGDMDILCKPEQNAQVRKAMEAMGYGDFQPGRKHDHYRYPPYLLVEMHRELVPASSTYSDYYRDIWQRCKPLADHSYSYEMSVEDGYIFCLVHLAGHFRDGGVGIRFIMDVYVYERLTALNRDYLKEQLEILGLSTFYANVVKLAKHWFGGEEGNDLTEAMAEYVYSGGLYGSVKMPEPILYPRVVGYAFWWEPASRDIRKCVRCIPGWRNGPLRCR